jgi:hypothetical protein
MKNVIETDATYTLSAIVKLAHKGARSSGVRFNEWQSVPTCHEAFRAALVGAWRKPNANEPLCALRNKSPAMTNAPPCSMGPG